MEIYMELIALANLVSRAYYKYG